MSASTFSSAHRIYVKSLYKRYLKNSLDWTIRRDLWRPQALLIRAEFEQNRDVHDPRALAAILEKAEADLAEKKHPDPYIPPTFPEGTKCPELDLSMTTKLRNMLTRWKLGAADRANRWIRGLAASTWVAKE